MRPIPPKLKGNLEEQPRMKACALAAYQGEYGICSRGKVDWHHVWTYAGRQINEAWAIVGACQRHHKEVNGRREVKEAFERISLRLAQQDDFDRYPRKDWHQIIRSLNYP